MRFQAGLYVGNSLGVVLKEDSMNAQFASARQGSLVIVKKDHLCWLHAKALAGQFINAPIRLGYSHFVRVDDEVGHLVKMVALLLSGPGANKAVANDSGQIAR